VSRWTEPTVEGVLAFIERRTPNWRRGNACGEYALVSFVREMKAKAGEE
jgi:hypothetical protein